MEHIIRAASTVADDDELVIIGSQAILGQFPDPPAELCVSVEADVYPKNHPARWDLQLGFPALYLAGGVLGAILIHDLIGLEARGILCGEESQAAIRRGFAPSWHPGRPWAKLPRPGAGTSRQRSEIATRGARADRVEGKGRPRGSGGGQGEPFGAGLTLLWPLEAAAQYPRSVRPLRGQPGQALLTHGSRGSAPSHWRRGATGVVVRPLASLSMTFRFLPALLSSAVLAFMPFASSCSSVSCGAGTVERGDQCVAVPAEEEVADLGFEGARAAGPASETSILVAWLPADTPDVVYNVYLATSEDGFNFSEPVAVIPSGSSTAVLGGLEEDTTYYVNVRASLDEVEAPNDAVVTTTTALDEEGPRFDGAVSAEAAPGAAVELTWEEATDDLTPSGALLYFVYAGPSADEVDTNNPISVSLPGATTVRVVLPAPEEEYFFLVQARDAAGNFDGNEEVLSAVSGEDLEAPTFAGCKSAVGRTASSILVAWDPATDDIVAEQDIVYNLYASETVDGFNFLAPDAQITGATSGLIPRLDRDTPYYVLCRAQDPTGNEDDNLRIQTARTKSDDVPPDFGGIVAVDNVTASSVDLVWTEATDNQTASEDIVYDVFLADEEDGFDFEMDEPWVTSEPGAAQITVEALDANTTYFVVVLARDEGENRSEPEPSVGIKTLISFQVNVLGIFASKGCAASSSCHAGASPSGFLSLSPALAYDNLVDVEASTLSGYMRVEPGNPDDSHLVHRIKGEFPGEPPPELARMPADGNFLSDAQIFLIEQWIAQGAENN